MDTIESSAPAYPSTDEKPDETIEAQYVCLERLADLEDRLAHVLSSTPRNAASWTAVCSASAAGASTVKPRSGTDD